MSWFGASKLFFIFLFFAVYASAAPKLIGIDSSQNTAILEFDQSLSSADIKAGSVDVPIAKKYFDIKAILGIKPDSLKTSFSEARYAQFSPEIVRVVFAAPKETTLQTKIDGKRLIITWSSKVSYELNTTKFIELSTKDEVKPQAIVQEDIIETFHDISYKKTKILTKNKLVVLDPGHGGKDSGAVGIGGRKEKDTVLNIAKYAKESLKERGYNVLMTRSDDVFIELKERTAFANSRSADIFVSIHANAVDKRSNISAHHGMETYFLSPARSERAMRVSALENGEDMEEMNALSKGTFLNFLNREKIVASNKLAIDYQKAALANIHSKYPSITDGGVREAPFWVLVGAQMPAILIEIGYISHPQEGITINDQIYQQLIGKAIADGIDSYFANQ